ncbi:MAG: hypothetical protein Tsb009_09450 [Planctomycetaceae bacterium]
MNRVRPFLLAILLPALIGVAGAGLAAHWLFHDWRVTFIAAIPCLLVGLAVLFILQSQSQRALTAVRMASQDRQQSYGIFSEVASHVQKTIGRLQEEQDESCKARTELEARFQLRRIYAEQLKAALQLVETPILITDLHQNIRYHNPAAATLFRNRQQEPVSALSVNDSPNPLADSSAVESKITLETFPEIKPLLYDACQRTDASDRRITEFEITLNESVQTIQATVHNICEPNGSSLGCVILLEDISENRQEKNKYAEFISSLSHEFKTPMASIRAFTELLIDGDVEDEEEKQKLYVFIEEQIERLTRLVHNMLNLTRIESGVIEVTREDCELNDVLTKSFNTVLPTAEEKNIRMKSELSDLYLAANVDRDLLGQAMINLLSNSVKYTPAGGEVSLHSRMDEGQAVIKVRDTGMGIPAESLNHIFERFYRVPENNEAASGTGLGLPLVHYIVTELHNGRIDVESEVGQGTTMTVTLPLGHRSSGKRKTPEAVCRTSS